MLVLVGVVACVGALLAGTSVVFARAGGPSQQVARIARTAGYGAPGPASTLVSSASQEYLTPGSPSTATNSSTATHSDTGTLPFTGLDLLVVAVIGAGLLGLGLRLRWSAARNAATA